MKSERVIKRSPDGAIELTETDGIKRVYSKKDEYFTYASNSWHMHPDGSRLSFHRNMPNPGVDILTYYPAPGEKSLYSRIMVTVADKKASLAGTPLGLNADFTCPPPRDNRGSSYTNFLAKDHQEEFTSTSDLSMVFSKGLQKFGFAIEARQPHDHQITYPEKTGIQKFKLTKRPEQDEQFLHECDLMDQAQWNSVGYPKFFHDLARRIENAQRSVDEVRAEVESATNIADLRRMGELMQEHHLDMEKSGEASVAEMANVQQKMTGLVNSVSQLIASLGPLAPAGFFSGQPRNQPRRRGLGGPDDIQL